MLRKKASMLSLCLLALGFTGNALADMAQEQEQALITLVAMEQVCDKTTPGKKSDVENAMATDSSLDEATKAEVRRIKADPAYKFKVSAMATDLMYSPIRDLVTKDLCNKY